MISARQTCRVIPEPSIEKGKVKITIRLDEDLLHHFGAMANATGGQAGYQTLINAALREYVEGKAPKFEETLRPRYSGRTGG